MSDSTPTQKLECSDKIPKSPYLPRYKEEDNATFDELEEMITPQKPKKIEIKISPEKKGEVVTPEAKKSEVFPENSGKTPETLEASKKVKAETETGKEASPLVEKKSFFSNLVSFLKKDSVKNTFIIGSLASWALPFFELVEKIQNTKKTVEEFTEKFSFKKLLPNFLKSEKPEKKEGKKKTEESQRNLENKRERMRKKVVKVPKGKVVYGDPKKYLADARKEKGKNYVWGDVGKNGYDCSGLTQKKAENQGISIPKGSFQQCEVGKKIRNKKDLKIGDLVFFLTDKSRGLDVTHVGIYSGKNKNGKQMYFNAKSKKKGILESALDEDEFKYARRIMSKNPELENA